MRIGILGYMGSIGQRHARNAMKLGHQVFGYDVVEGDKGPWTRQSVIDNAEAVIIATPSKLHMPDMMDCLDKGKHVLVEKPFCYDCPPFAKGYVQGTRMRWPGIVIATGYNLRFHTAVEHVKEVLLSGRIGTFKSAVFRVEQKSTKEPYLMDGVVRNWASHEIDLCRHLLGDFKVVDCHAQVEKGNDVGATIMLQNDMGDPVSILTDYFADPERRSFEIYGSKGHIYCNLVTRKVKVWSDKDSEFNACDTWDQNYVDELDAFVIECQGGYKTGKLATGEDGVAAMEIVMAARKLAGLE